jgi:hypothetical protein
VIISNNSQDYETDWDIVNVPEDYRDWYIANVKCSENAWYAPMNRSYAIKYAREHGYDYLVQLDDNIVKLEIATLGMVGDGITKRVRVVDKPDMMNEYIEMLCTVLENTNAAMAGCQLAGLGTTETRFLAERYCYSLFALDLSVCPDVFQGDFEDDIEYRLKCAQMGLPVVQVSPLRYGKIGQNKTKDLTGCRAEYVRAGLKRGEHMQILYGDVYRCKMRQKGQSIKAKYDSEKINFKHFLTPFKVGVVIYDYEKIKQKMRDIFKKYDERHTDKIVIKEKKVKKS